MVPTNSLATVVLMDIFLMIRYNSASLAVHQISNMTGNFRSVLSAQREHGLMRLSKFAKTAHPVNAFPANTHQLARVSNVLIVSLVMSLILPRSSVILSAAILNIGAGTRIHVLIVPLDNI